MTFLLLPHWTEREIDDTAKGRITVHATYNKLPDACPVCGCIANLYKWSAKDQEFVDSPVRGCSVRIVVSRQRYRCRECSGTFFQPLPDMDDSHRMTRRCVEYIERQSIPLTFAHVAQNLDIDPKTVRNIFDAHTESRKSESGIIAPKYLGIDEKTILKRAQCIFTDIGERKPLDILTSHTQPSVARWLTLLKEKQRVEVVNIDMWRAYKNASKAVLPNAAIVIDHFHVVKPANQCMDNVRKVYGNTGDDKRRVAFKRSAYLLKKRKSNLTDQKLLDLEAWLATEPVLRGAYELKEAFFDIYTHHSRHDAERAYEEWKKSIPASIHGYFEPLVTSVTNWHEEVFDFFDHRTSNAYTESLNSIINNKIGNGRGYSFDVIRAKILFADYAPKPLRSKKVKKETVTMPSPSEHETYIEHGGICFSCKGKYDEQEMHIEHFRPKSVPISILDSGAPQYDNLLLVCATCNDRFNKEADIDNSQESTD